VNINTFDLNLLRVLDALYSTHSTTLAGAQIGLTQSAISNSLRRLREAFGDELFVRTERGMVPTPLAESMYGPIQDALGRIREVVESRASFDASVSQRNFRLAMSDIGQMWMVPRLVSHVHKLAPGITLETVPLTRSGTAELMAAGEIDLALGVGRPLGAGFFRQQLRTLRFVCIARAGHPHFRGELDIKQFLGASFIDYEPAGGTYSHFLEHANRVFVEHKVQRRVAVKLAHLPGIDKMIAATDLVAVVSEGAAMSMTGAASLQILDLPFEVPPMCVTQQWHERIHKDPAQEWLREAIVKVASNFPGSDITSVNSLHSQYSFDAVEDIR